MKAQNKRSVNKANQVKYQFYICSKSQEFLTFIIVRRSWKVQHPSVTDDGIEWCFVSKFPFDSYAFLCTQLPAANTCVLMCFPGTKVSERFCVWQYNNVMPCQPKLKVEMFLHDMHTGQSNNQIAFLPVLACGIMKRSERKNCQENGETERWLFSWTMQ